METVTSVEQFRRAVRRRMPLRWRRRVAVFAGGIIGTAGRASIADLFADTGHWPWPTLLVNLTGAFLLGVVAQRMVKRGAGHRLAVAFLAIGVLGAYTTFGAFVLEDRELAAAGMWWLAVAYPLVSVVGGLAAALAGVRLAKRWR